MLSSISFTSSIKFHEFFGKFISVHCSVHFVSDTISEIRLNEINIVKIFNIKTILMIFAKELLNIFLLTFKVVFIH